MLCKLGQEETDLRYKSFAKVLKSRFMPENPEIIFHTTGGLLIILYGKYCTSARSWVWNGKSLSVQCLYIGASCMQYELADMCQTRFRVGHALLFWIHLFYQVCNDSCYNLLV